MHAAEPGARDHGDALMITPAVPLAACVGETLKVELEVALDSCGATIIWKNVPGTALRHCLIRPKTKIFLRFFVISNLTPHA
jgi:hypothetical protein